MIALHGFGLAPRAFVDVAALLDGPLHAPELPGHGGQEAQAFDDVVAGLVRLVAAQERLPVLWGYSLGARLALAVALQTPLAGLVLESGSAGLPDEQRAARVLLDDDRARDLERRGVDAFFVDWDAQPLFAAVRADVAARRTRLRAGHDPRRLAAALRAFSPGHRPALHALLPRLAVPTLVIAGTDDERFVAEARALHAIPSSALVVIEGCGHAPHLEHPRAVAHALTAFQQRIAQEQT